MAQLFVISEIFFQILVGFVAEKRGDLENELPCISEDRYFVYDF